MGNNVKKEKKVFHEIFREILSSFLGVKHVKRVVNVKFHKHLCVS